MKFSWTKVGVMIFILLLLFASHYARAEDGAKISLGHTVFNSTMTVGEVGYEYANWEAAATQLGSGDTKNGSTDETAIYSVSHLVRPEWDVLWSKNYYRLGVAYVNDSPLVGDTNFRLGIGLDYEVFAIEYFHYSSAGIHETNTGIDGIQLRMNIPQ